MKTPSRWTTEDFESMSWHDVHVHGFRFASFDEDGGAADLVLDIDYILEWKPKGGVYYFTVCPAELRFKDVSDLRFSLDYTTRNSGMYPFCIFDITRELLEFPNGYKSYRWVMEINRPCGEIQFQSPGFTQTLTGTPVHDTGQYLEPAQRGEAYERGMPVHDSSQGLVPEDKNKSPVDWYYGSYLLRFIELDDANRNDPEARFTSWENTVLVKASTIEAAYAKVERIGKQESEPYKGGPQGVPVQWEYLGITQILPVYEEIADGAEIAWTERKPRKLKTLQQWVRPKSAIRQ